MCCIDDVFIKNHIKKFFSKVFNVEDVNKIYQLLTLDEEYYKIHNITLKNSNAGLRALAFYRICNYYLPHINKQLLLQLKDYCVLSFNNYINPFSKVNKGFVILGVGNNIGKNVNINENVTIYNNTHINDQISTENDKNTLNIDKNAILGNNVVLYGNINIGKNVIVCDNAIIRENIKDYSVVNIINQLQIKQEKVSKLPSQSSVVYGITRKFKNTIIIFGESFYNPKIILRLGNKKEIPQEITYWDKNKIIIKIKYAVYNTADIKGSYIVLMSNSNKITILNNMALEKCLTNLCE